MHAHLQKRIGEAKDYGLGQEERTRLEKMLREYKDVVRVRLNGGPPANVQPHIIRVKPDFVPIRAKPKRYPP